MVFVDLKQKDAEVDSSLFEGVRENPVSPEHFLNEVHELSNLISKITLTDENINLFGLLVEDLLSVADKSTTIRFPLSETHIEKEIDLFIEKLLHENIDNEIRSKILEKLTYLRIIFPVIKAEDFVLVAQKEEQALKSPIGD